MPWRQGAVIVSGFTAQGQAEQLTQGVPTAGRVPEWRHRRARGDGRIRRPADADAAAAQSRFLDRRPHRRRDQRLYQPALRHARRAERDSRTVVHQKPNGISAARFMPRSRTWSVESDTPARVVIDERTGTIVIGNDVKISRGRHQPRHADRAHHRSAAASCSRNRSPRARPPSNRSPRSTPTQPDAPRRGARRTRPRNAGLRPQPPRRQAGRHHRHPAGHQVGRRPAGRSGSAIGACR